MVTQNNIPGLNSKRLYNKNSSKLAKSLEKLSSGYSINRAADDAAGLAVSEKMRSQIFGIKQAVRNCSDGVSLIQTFEGALGETVTIIKRMKSLADQAANGTYDDYIDRAAIKIEYDQLCDEVNHIADTDFNGIVMLNGRSMADKFTFISENGTMWLTPSKAEFPKESFISTFKEVEGFPDITMSIELLPDAKEKLVSDRELMLAFEKLNEASVKSFYDKGIPKFSLEGLNDEDIKKFSIETTGSSAIISTYTAQSGKVDIARVDCTELPHYASTSATGLWRNSSVATGSYAALSNTDPDGNPINQNFDLSKWTASYVNSSSATKEERQAYLDWIKATDGRATLIPDDEFDEDKDPLKFTWNVDGKEYENEVGTNGVPKADSGVTVPVYPAGYTGGPQIYVQNLRFTYDDEDMKDGAYFYISSSTYSYVISGTGDSRASISASSKRYTDIWLENGNVNITLTYDKANDIWHDSLGGSGDTSSATGYGIGSSPYSSTSSYYSKNLKNYYEKDGKLPDGFQLNVSITCPRSRTTGSNGWRWSETTSHNDKSHYWSNSEIIDFRMDEYDPAHPEQGGVDYTVAEHGATFTYDGRTQDDGTVGVWRDNNGNAVDLEEKGIYLPTKPDSREVLELHDGMSITVNNPTMVGEDYIQADIRLFDDDRSVNAYRRIYENITYADSLVLQTGARTKDSVEFTFSYSASGIGDLNADLNCTAKGLGLDVLSLSKQESANYAIDRLDHALNKLSMIRATFGVAQNRLEHKIDNLNNTTENLTVAESQIRDTDMAREMMNFTKQQIITQSSQSMLAQATSLPQQVLSLISP